MSVKPWERQRGESQKAFEAFTIYRDMGPKRSIQKVAQQLSKSGTLIKRWSSQWNWVERVKQYDIKLDEEYRLQQQEERKKMMERHAKQAMMFQNKVVERLRSIDPNKLSPADLIRWFDIAVKVERLARGEEEQQNDMSININVRGTQHER